jgi:hypothetical protein
MREIFPGVPLRAVILADGAPLAFAEIRPPTFPMDGALFRFLQPLFFSRERDRWILRHGGFPCCAYEPKRRLMVDGK